MPTDRNGSDMSRVWDGAQEGADYSKGGDWEEHVVVDGNLVTGKRDHRLCGGRLYSIMCWAAAIKCTGYHNCECR